MNWRNLIALMLAQATLGSVGPMMVLLNGFVGARLAPSEALATLGMGMLVAGTASSSLWAARVAQRKGRRFGFYLGVAIAVAGSLACIGAIQLESFVLYCLAMFFLGGAVAFTQQLRFAAAENAPPAMVGKAVALILFAGIGSALLGPRLGALAVEWVPGVPYGGSYWMLANLALLAGLALLLFRDVEPTAGSTAVEQAHTGSLWNRQFGFGVLCGAVAYGVMSLVMTATPISMHHHQGMSLADTSTVIQAHIVAMFVPSLFSALLIGWLGPYRMALAGLFCNAVCIVLALSGVAFVHYFAALVLLGIGWNLLFIAGTQLVATAWRGPERFRAQAINDFTVFGVQGVAALSAGGVLSWLGWVGVNGLSAMLLTVCFVVWLRLVLLNRHDLADAN